MPCQHRDLNKPTITGEGVPCTNPEIMPGWCVEHAPTHRCFFNLRSRNRCTAQSEPGQSWCREHMFVHDIVNKPPPPDPMVKIHDEIQGCMTLEELKEWLIQHFTGR